MRRADSRALLHRGQQQGDQHANDRDDDEQFDERERSSQRSKTLHDDPPRNWTTGGRDTQATGRAFPRPVHSKMSERLNATKYLLGIGSRCFWPESASAKARVSRRSDPPGSLRLPLAWEATLGLPGLGVSPRITAVRVASAGPFNTTQSLSSRRSAMLDLFRRLSAKTWMLLILSIVLATGAAGCGSKDSAATAQAKKFRPADAAGDASSDTGPATGAAAANEFGSATPLEVRQGGTGSATGAPPRTDGNARSTPSGKGGDAAVASASAAGSVSPQLQQLLDQFNRLGEQQPKGSNQQEQLEDFVRNQQQRLAVGKKILAMNPDAEVKKQLVPQMYQVFTVFGRVGVPNARQQMTDFAKSLMADRDATIARMGRHMMFDMNVSRLANEAAGDGKGIVAEVQTLLDAEKGQLSEDTLDLASQAAEILMQTGMKDDAVRTLDLIAKAAAADPKLANQSLKYTDTAKLAKADLTTLLTNLIKTGQKEDEQKLVAAISGLLKELKPSRELFSSLQQVGQILETTGNLDAAKRCYDELEQAFQSSEDKDVAETATQIAAGARKRLSLVGQPLNVEGLTPDGKPFDWSAYQGKVVLLDFWATWCGPCLEGAAQYSTELRGVSRQGF